MVASQAAKKWSFKGPNLPIDTVIVYRPHGAQVIRKLDLDLEVGLELHLTIQLIAFRLISHD